MNVSDADIPGQQPLSERLLMLALLHHALGGSTDAHGHEHGGPDHALVETETSPLCVAFGLEQF